MFRHFNLATGILALVLFSYAQYRGWDPFDSVANPNGHSSGGHSGSSRTYHK